MSKTNEGNKLNLDIVELISNKYQILNTLCILYQHHTLEQHLRTRWQHLAVTAPRQAPTAPMTRLDASSLSILLLLLCKESLLHQSTRPLAPLISLLPTSLHSTCAEQNT
jgi:hypothetical protein